MGTSRRGVLVAVAAVVTARALLGSTAQAQPTPPPNPDDAQLEAGQQGVDAAARDIAELQNQLAEATAAVDAAQDELGRALEEATAAEATRDAARAVADAAQDQVAATRAGQEVADGLAEDARAALDGFIGASYRQGSTAGSASGFVGVTDPDDVLDRAELLAALGSSQQDALDALGRAQVGKANQDALAREALEAARVREEEAEQASAAAAAAYSSAVDATEAATARNDALLATQADVQLQLDVAQQALASLQGQRRTYEEFLRVKAEEEARARAAAAAAEAARQQAIREESARVAAEQQEAARQAAAQASRDAAARAAAQRNNTPPPPPAPAPVASSSSSSGSDSTVAPPPAAPVQVAPPSSSGTVAPASGRLSSGFGARSGGMHYGIDIANRIGTPLYSVQAGTVISAGPASGFGLWVRVRHGDGTITVYGHNDSNIVSVGQRVSAGQQIAFMGNRGQSTGPHVHFEVAPGGGRKVDPLTWLRSRGVSV